MKNKRTAVSFAGWTCASESARRAAQGASKKSNTKCERALGRALSQTGLRYQRTVAGLPGRPDFVFLRHKLAVFCAGYFWHGRNLAWRLSRLAGGHNPPYWVEKVQIYVARDQVVANRLPNEAWRVVRLWEMDILQDPSGAAAGIAALLK